MSYSPTGQIAHRFLRTAHGDVVSTNERWVLRQIWLHPGISRSEITSRSDLAQQSIHRILDHLGERGVISFGEPKSGLGRGQPSPMLSLNGSHAYSCGISVNTDVMGICLMNLAGEVLGEASLPLLGQKIEDALAEAEEKIAKLRQALSLDPESCFGLGLGIAGYYVGGTRYNASLPLHEWSLVELGPLMSNFFGKPAWVHNGGSTGAVAEALFGVGRYIRHFAYLSFNYGFGGGMISDGELLVGGNGNAGEYGPIFRGNVPRPALQFLIERLRANGIEIQSITQLQRQFNPDWPGVADWVEETAPYYNRLIDAIIGVFDPQAIVFGGQVPPALAQMLIARSDAPEPARYGVPRPAAKLIVSEINGDAQALGAAALPFKSEFF
ncbi:ROK family transcriptional regulator [Mesorhizobium sp. LjRoot246]|uniref:ROK family transcriptional regulator n=1 Tax=Mesorhizobium sp. LjRoot246 TaxID=3342294 RepID=UPI003ECEBD29